MERLATGDHPTMRRLDTTDSPMLTTGGFPRFS
jgi:hypothetical protein